MPVISFFVEGEPKAQPRAKAATRGGHAFVYDPGSAKDWKTRVRNAWTDMRGEWHGDLRFADDPIALELTFYLQRPQAHFKKGALRPTAPEYVTTKPDFDNLAKAVADALDGTGLWHDDAQIAHSVTTKKYANDARLGCEIVVRSLTTPQTMPERTSHRIPGDGESLFP